LLLSFGKAYPTDPVERLVVEQALALVRELKLTCATAPYGQVLDSAEQVAVRQGRELTRQVLEAVLNLQADTAEKKGRRDGAVAAKEAEKTKAGPPGRS
jgi:hypothetical protein